MFTLFFYFGLAVLNDPFEVINGVLHRRVRPLQPFNVIFTNPVNQAWSVLVNCATFEIITLRALFVYV
jgi:hypothetical protein